MWSRNSASHVMQATRLVRLLSPPIVRPQSTPLAPVELLPSPSPSLPSLLDTLFQELPLRAAEQQKLLFGQSSSFLRRSFGISLSGGFGDCTLKNFGCYSVALTALGSFRQPSPRYYSSKVAEVKRTEIDDPRMDILDGTYSRNSLKRKIGDIAENRDYASLQQAVTTALWCNFLVFSLKFGIWLVTSSHVMFAEVVHSVADFANQALLAYGLTSSRRAPDAMHPYGYSKERFVWSLISAVGIFCLGSGATIVHGFQHLWSSQPPPNMNYAALVIGGSFIIEGASLLVAINAVKRGAAAEGMKVCDYVWRGHDPTSVAVMTEDGAAVTGLAIAAVSLVAAHMTGNAIYDAIGSIVVGHLLGMVAIFLIQRNRHALIGRAIDDHDMEKVLRLLKSDPVVDALYDCKSEVIGPGFFRFKAEIDFNGVVVVQNYLERTGREEWAQQFRDAAQAKDDAALLKMMSCYGEEVVTALGSEVDRLEKEIQNIVPGIRHVDIEAHNPKGASP